jgi:hypothetical protein
VRGNVRERDVQTEVHIREIHKDRCTSKHVRINIKRGRGRERERWEIQQEKELGGREM